MLTGLKVFLLLVLSTECSSVMGRLRSILSLSWWIRLSSMLGIRLGFDLVYHPLFSFQLRSFPLIFPSASSVSLQVMLLDCFLCFWGVGGTVGREGGCVCFCLSESPHSVFEESSSEMMVEMLREEQERSLSGLFLELNLRMSGLMYGSLRAYSQVASASEQFLHLMRQQTLPWMSLRSSTSSTSQKDVSALAYSCIIQK